MFNFLVEAFTGGGKNYRNTRNQRGGMWGNPDTMERLTRVNAPKIDMSTSLLLPKQYLTGRCQQIIIKSSQEQCPKPVHYVQESTEVRKIFCPKHRECFYPLENGKRCNKDRMHVGTKYCELHVNKEKWCGEKVNEYKRICPSNIRQCNNNISLEENRAILDETEKCLDGREMYESNCIHESVRSAGHIYHLDMLRNNFYDCEDIIG